jgi:hypothetical protein
MDVSWQDNVPSFLDASSPGAGGFAGPFGDVGAPWFASADGGLFSGQPVLWWDNGTDSAGGASRLGGLAGFEPSVAASPDALLVAGWIAKGTNALLDPTSLDGRVLWADTAGSTSNWLPYGSDADRFDLAGGAPQWPTADTWFHEATNLLWAGGTDQAPITLGGFAEPTFAALTPAHLVWTDPAQWLPGIASDPTGIGAAPMTLLSGVGIAGPSSDGLPISGAESR